MREAFSGVYGRWNSPAAKVFGPIIDWRTYARAARLGIMFPLGIAYFVTLTVAFSVGGALIWTIVGPLILIPTLFLTRWAGDGEAWTVRHLANIELRRPPTAIDLNEGRLRQIWTRLIDPSTWTGLVYLLAQFPIGSAAFIMLVTGGALAGAFLGAPIIFGVTDEVRTLTLWGMTDEVVTTDNWSMALDTWQDGLILMPFGLLTFLLLVHLVSVFSALHAVWARLLLGTRAMNIPEPLDPSDLDPEPTEPGPGTPLAEVNVPKPPSKSTPAPAILPQPPADGVSGTTALTAREKEVLVLIARGHSNAEIGRRCLSVKVL